MTQGNNDTTNGIPSAMWTPTSLLFDDSPLFDFNSNTKPTWVPNNNPSTTYNNNIPGHPTTAALPLPLTNNPYPRYQTTAFAPQPAPNTPTDNWMSPTTAGIPPEQLYQDYAPQPCVRTPLTSYSSPVLPFLDGEHEISPDDYAQYVQGNPWNAGYVKKPEGC